MKRVPLSGESGAGLFALVDDQDFDRVMGAGPWRLFEAFGKRYASNGDNVFMHRLVNGTPDDLCTDHRDNDGLNNRRSNLRNATRRQNTLNRRPRGYREGRRFKGILRRKSGAFGAHITQRGHRYFLGSYSDLATAALAYDNAARALFGEFAWLNLPHVDASLMLPEATRETVRLCEERETACRSAAIAREIAEAVPPAEVAALYSVSIGAVLSACEEHGVGVPAKTRIVFRPTTGASKEAARLLVSTDLSLREVGDAVGLTRERARQIRDRLFLAGALPAFPTEKATPAATQPYQSSIFDRQAA